MAPSSDADVHDGLLLYYGLSGGNLAHVDAPARGICRINWKLLGLFGVGTVAWRPAEAFQVLVGPIRGTARKVSQDVRGSKLTRTTR